MEPKNPQIKQNRREDGMRARMANRALADSSSANAAKGVFKSGVVNKTLENFRELGTRDVYNTSVGELKDLHDKHGISTEVSGDALKRKVSGKQGKYHTEE